MFRDLLLADRFHLIAPDIAGFGQSEAPARGNFAYTFDNLARIIQRIIEVLGIGRFALYAFDIGAPIGFRVAMTFPERVTAIIPQNGNAYEEGLSDVWDPIRRYWSDPTTANRDALREIMKPLAICALALHNQRSGLRPSLVLRCSSA
jgi:pimeloyl-ACP methyl ester carboxylesterase